MGIATILPLVFGAAQTIMSAQMADEQRRQARRAAQAQRNVAEKAGARAASQQSVNPNTNATPLAMETLQKGIASMLPQAATANLTNLNQMNNGSLANLLGLGDNDIQTMVRAMIEQYKTQATV
ncbi:MAG: hypothetical protein KatS3mg087_1760 [Patescibacteria group bacterium]|nr:MAG: hypothetical protein KatS3mg087_1760 [Patescibacteria group bacterium]